jgi:hypothetical protein
VGAGEPVGVRSQAVAAVRWLASLPVRRIVLLGAADVAGSYGPGSAGSFAGYGVDLSVRLPGERVDDRQLPLSLAVGAWLLERAGWTGEAVAVACDSAADLPGRELALGPGDGLLVMGDGSARRTEKAPGWLDDRAAGFDETVAKALASGSPEQLRRIDQELGLDLLAAGAPAWRAAGELLAGTAWDGAVSYDDAPYGVGYFVAAWLRPGRG